ncbi:MAG: RraA family protein [Chloroflexota bacterium]
MAPLWTTDDELFTLARNELFTSVVGDIMDTMGLLIQFLPPDIRPIQPKAITIGRAMTVLEADYLMAEQGATELATKPFGLMLNALDDLKPNEVYICSGGSPRYAMWGGLMATRARHLKSVGAVMNGYHRDTNELLELDFPVFSMGAYAQDQGPRGKVVDYRLPIQFAGVRIEPGDIVFGDVDGVCVVPKEAEEEAFTKALEKARGEQVVREKIEDGMSATEAFATYGIL